MKEGLSSAHDDEFNPLRSSKQGSYAYICIKVALAALALLLIAVLASYAFHTYSGDVVSADRAREEVLALQQPWADSLVDGWDAYRDWIERHGVRSEQTVFDDLSAMVMESLLDSNVAHLPREDLSLFGRIYLGIHAGILRLLFLCIASLRLCLAVSAITIYLGFLACRPYRADDALGQMGNGRVFYSGVRAGLETLSASGAPDVQIRGFACPQMGNSAEARASTVWKRLTEYNASNQTNESLIRVLVKNASIAPYVAAADEDKLLSKAFKGGELLSNAERILSAALSLHKLYSAGTYSVVEPAETRGSNSGPEDSDTYAGRILSALHTVLSQEMRETIGTLSSAEVATTILAFESGKVLAHGFEGGRWVRKSNFPHLCARAVLHSISDYPRDYTFEQRHYIRRSLIYAARKSAFAPVRMPVDMCDQSWALRQWMEILLACPHELAAVTHEVELVGIVREAHLRWYQEFFDGRAFLAPEAAAQGYATPTNLLFVPISQVVQLLRRVVSKDTISRMHFLLDRVAAQQRLQRIHSSDDDTGPSEQLSFDRLPDPPSQKEIEDVAMLHGLRSDEVSDWCALRVILSSYGWLASRVGDYSVPSTSIIFAVFKCQCPLEGCNALGFLGKPGMVPFRGSKFDERWGRNWTSRFNNVQKATMAETREDYEKLLQGIEEVEDLESEFTANPPVSIS